MTIREKMLNILTAYLDELLLHVQQPRSNFSWNEYEEFLSEEIKTFQRLIAEYDATGTVDPDATEILSAGYT